MKIIFDSQFQTDSKRVVRRYPHTKDEIRELIYAIEELGGVPPTYDPHLLTHARGTCTGYWGSHLQEGAFDVIMVYHQRQKT